MAAAAHCAVAALSLALLWAGAQGCSLPPRGCTAATCAALEAQGFGTTQPIPYLNSKTHITNTLIGWYYGTWNSAASPYQNFSSQPGAPPVNYEVVQNIGVGAEAGFLVGTVPGPMTIGKCCAACAQTPGCLVYLFYQSGNWAWCQKPGSTANATKMPNGWVMGTQCYLLSGGSDTTEAGADGFPVSAPYTGTHNYQYDVSPYTATTGTYVYPPAWIGGRCNPGPNVTDDPHFVGNYGTRYDFNGEVDKVFALISDERLHVNVKLGGYEDTRTYGATKLKNGKAIRTWIKEVGMLWVDIEGSRHTLHLTARSGNEQALKDGFLARLTSDGADVAVPAFGEEIAAGSLTLKHLSAEKLGPYDLEKFSLEIAGLLKLNLQMRPAHPLLQTPTDAQVHFNINIDRLEASPKVHGVLGQTFRKTNSQFVRALEYQLLSKLLGHPVAADGDSGLGFLDGQPQDYIVPSILSTECKFSSFQ